MIAALRYEWTRLATLRSTWWISGGTLLVGILVTTIAALIFRFNINQDLLAGQTLDDEWSRFYVEAAMTQFSNVDPMFYLLAFVASILGVLAWGHEYRHGMIRATLTAVPQRSAVFAAKYVVVALWITVLVVISCLVSLVVALIVLAGVDVDYQPLGMLEAIGRHIVYAVLLAWLAMSLTVLVRHQTFSLVLIFLWPMGIETLLKGLAGIVSAVSGKDGLLEATRFLPFNAGGRIMQNFGTTPDGIGFGLQKDLNLFGDPLSFWGGLIVFGGFTLLLMGAALASFQSRDA
jgi:ABC-2 type transport system permease protein